MEARGISTQVAAESRRISKVNRDIARQQATCERLKTGVKLQQTLEQVRYDSCNFCELFIC